MKDHFSAYHHFSLLCFGNGEGAREGELAREGHRAGLEPLALFRLQALAHEALARVTLEAPRARPLVAVGHIDFDSVPTDGREHPRSLVMEDTGWPHAPLDDYTEFWNTGYYVPLTQGKFWYEVTASFQTAFGTGLRPEAILWQRLFDNVELMKLFSEGDETAEKSPTPGSFIDGPCNIATSGRASCFGSHPGRRCSEQTSGSLFAQSLAQDSPLGRDGRNPLTRVGPPPGPVVDIRMGTRSSAGRINPSLA